MQRFVRVAYLFCILGGTVFALSGCAIIPSLPAERELPLQEILEHTVCELRDAFQSLRNEQFSKFKPDDWAIAVTLIPKVDAGVVMGAGGSLKSTTQPVSAVKSLVTWAIGSPGLQLDSHAQRSSGVTYAIESKKLMAETALICDKETENYHALTRHLGIGDWLARTVLAMDRTTSVELDKPNYNSTITIKFSGNGSYTYAFFEGTGLLNLSGDYKVDEQLNIALTPVKPPKKFKVVSLPYGEEFGTKRTAQSSSDSEAFQNAKQRLDLLQLEQAIRNIQDLPR